jgi:hypothetical protein
MTQEGLQALCAFRGRLNERLMLIPEYRAIGVIDRTIKEISEILATTSDEWDRTNSPARSIPEPAPLAEAAQARIASAIAEAIEGKAQPRMQRMPQAGAYALVSAAS